jgi:hypothetical protein
VDAARNFKANLKVEGHPCGWCQSALALGEDTSVCTACEVAHHARCWEGKAGCSSSACANAPLRQLAPAVVSTQAAGLKECPSCRQQIHVSNDLCPFCNAVATVDGVYRGPTTRAPGATASLVYGIVGLLICGVILGPLAIHKAGLAREAMRRDPTLDGHGLATAGTVLGVLDLICWVIILLVRLGSH